MAATTATSAFFVVTSSAPESGAKATNKLRVLPKSTETRGLQLKANVQAPSRTNDTTIKPEDHKAMSMMSAEKQSVVFERNQNYAFDPVLVEQFGSGTYLPSSPVFRQYFSIRTYEIGVDGTASLETLMNLFQETAVNHVKGIVAIDGLGSTPEMSKRNLIWVTTKVHVAVDHYPSCGDSVHVDTWIAMSGKNCIRRDSLMRDCTTGNILARVSGVWVTMNTETRRVCKIPDEVRAEIINYLTDAPPIVEDDNQKPLKLDETTPDKICLGLKPRWSDLDANKHVNNSKYISLILESVPQFVLKNHELSRITMEYKRECHRDSVLQSLTTVSGGGEGSFVDHQNMKCCHLLRHEGGLEIMKARTEWRPKCAHNLITAAQF